MMPAVRPAGQGRQDEGGGANEPLAPLYNGWLHPAAVWDLFEQQVALGGDPANLAFPAFPDNDDITLFMDEVVPHFA